MPEIQSSESLESDRLSSILAGFLTPKELAGALTERTIARWHRHRQGPPRVTVGRKVYYRQESVDAWLTACEKPEPRARATRVLRVRQPVRSSVSFERNELSAAAGSGGGND
jgi:hypothetical protein